MSAINLKATPCFKGERGYSAYEVAVQNGFVGTEQDWLAMLGTSSKYERIIEVYTTTEENETTFDIPGNYTSNSFVEVYVEGSKIDADSFTINAEENKVILTNALSIIGTKVEVILSTFSTNDLPIVTNIDENSTDDTVASAKCVYNELKNIKERLDKIGG